MSYRLLMPSCRAWAIVSLMLVVGGCGGKSSDPPLKVHPVKGKVLTKSGQPAAGGAVEFVRQSDPPLSARSEVGTDGSFSLFTMTAEGKKYDGTEEGEYQVTYIPHMTEHQTEQPVKLPQKLKVEAKPNEVTLKLP